jgi:hypothetical protein
MPVRNEERSVADAISSVLGQTLTDLEILVIDGASDDATVSVVSELARTDPRIRLLDNPDRTIPHALNIGLNAARGRYVARVDAHASVSVDYLERGIAALDNDREVASIGGRRIGVGKTPTARCVAAALSSPFGVGNSINHFGSQAQDTDHASFAVSRTDVRARSTVGTKTCSSTRMSISTTGSGWLASGSATTHRWRSTGTFGGQFATSPASTGGTAAARPPWFARTGGPPSGFGISSRQPWSPGSAGPRSPPSADTRGSPPAW